MLHSYAKCWWHARVLQEDVWSAVVEPKVTRRCWKESHDIYWFKTLKKKKSAKLLLMFLFSGRKCSDASVCDCIGTFLRLTNWINKRDHIKGWCAMNVAMTRKHPFCFVYLLFVIPLHLLEPRMLFLSISGPSLICLLLLLWSEPSGLWWMSVFFLEGFLIVVLVREVSLPDEKLLQPCDVSLPLLCIWAWECAEGGRISMCAAF